MNNTTEGAQIAYAFANDESYLIELHKHYYRQSRWLRHLKILQVFSAIAFAFAIARSVVDRDWLDLLIPGVAFFYLVFFHPINDRFVRRRARRSPCFNEVVQVQLSDGGFALRSPSITTDTKWNAITGAAAFEDGLLLSFGPRSVRWLPDAGLTSGTSGDARALIRNHVANSTTFSLPGGSRMG